MFKIGTSKDWRARTEDIAQTTFVESGIKQMSKNKLRLSLQKKDGKILGAGLTSLISYGYGLYELEITQRLDQMDPNTVFAFWFRNSSTEDEIDIIEATRWGDINQPHIFWITLWENSSTPSTVREFPARAFSKYKFTCDLQPTNTIVKGYGFINDNWKEIYSVTNKTLDFGFVPKIALWVKDGKFIYNTTSLNGPLSVDLDAFRYTPTLTTPGTSKIESTR